MGSICWGLLHLSLRANTIYLLKIASALAGVNILKKQRERLCQTLSVLAVTLSPLAPEQISPVTGLHVLNKTGIARLNCNREILTQ